MSDELVLRLRGETSIGTVTLYPQKAALSCDADGRIVDVTLDQGMFDVVRDAVFSRKKSRDASSQLPAQFQEYIQKTMKANERLLVLNSGLYHALSIIALLKLRDSPVGIGNQSPIDIFLTYLGEEVLNDIKSDEAFTRWADRKQKQLEEEAAEDSASEEAQPEEKHE